MILVLLVLGLPVGPLMVTVFAIGGHRGPGGGSLGTVMTALASGIVAGTALGSSIAGQLAQNEATPRRHSWSRCPPLRPCFRLPERQRRRPPATRAEDGARRLSHLTGARGLHAETALC